MPLSQFQCGQVLCNQFRRERLDFQIEVFREPIQHICQLFPAQVGFAVRLGLFLNLLHGIGHGDLGKFYGVTPKPIAGDFQRSCPSSQHSADFADFPDELVYLFFYLRLTLLAFYKGAGTDDGVSIGGF